MTEREQAGTAADSSSKEKFIYSKVKVNAAEQEAGGAGGSVPVTFALSGCSLKLFGLHSFSSLPVSLAPQQWGLAPVWWGLAGAPCGT